MANVVHANLLAADAPDVAGQGHRRPARDHERDATGLPGRMRRAGHEGEDREPQADHRRRIGRDRVVAFESARPGAGGNFGEIAVGKGTDESVDLVPDGVVHLGGDFVPDASDDGLLERHLPATVESGRLDQERRDRRRG